MVNRINSWLPEHDELLLSDISNEELVDRTGRSMGAVTTRRAMVRRSTDVKLQEEVRARWAEDRAFVIAKDLGVKENIVHMVATRLALGPSLGVRRGGRRSGHEASVEALKGVPDKPRGYTRATVAEAMLYARPPRSGGSSPDQEYGMMLQLHADRTGLKLSWECGRPVLA